MYLDQAPTTRLTDAQSIFDTVAAHLLSMERQSRAMNFSLEGDQSKCMYRSPDGNRCAVGILIPDELYDEAFEGKTACELIELCPKLEHLRPYAILLTHLQEVHDAESNWGVNGLSAVGLGYLGRVADAHNLVFNV